MSHGTLPLGKGSTSASVVSNVPMFIHVVGRDMSAGSRRGWGCGGVCVGGGGAVYSF